MQCLLALVLRWRGCRFFLVVSLLSSNLAPVVLTRVWMSMLCCWRGNEVTADLGECNGSLLTVLWLSCLYTCVKRYNLLVTCSVAGEITANLAESNDRFMTESPQSSLPGDWHLLQMQHLCCVRRLQMVLNAAARLVVGAGKFEHITPTLCDVLHWLPVRQRILYKITATAFDCIGGTGPAYFKHVCTLVADVTGRAHLRSAERRDMLVPRTRTELGRRSFQVAAPTVWNSLPAHLRSTLISRRQLRDGLKSHLFTEAYFWSSENICFKNVIYLLTYLLTITEQ